MTSANVADNPLTQSDELLLARFLDARDEAAFAGLVERHGRTVWAVCRRFLERKEDLEDAFQAVFFVLARKAATIRKGEAVGSWLYGVACRTAMKARRTALRRDVHEKRVAKSAPEQAPSSEMVSRELQRALDEEVQRLGEKYKAAFVLCFLEGMSRTDAARTLGLTESTLAGRLARARTQLQKRLGQRGITLTAALTAVAMAQSVAAAAVPEGFAPGAVTTALAPDGSETHALSPAAQALAAHVMRGMLPPRLGVGAAVLVLISLLVGGTSLAAFVQWDLSPAAPGDVNVPPVKIAKVRVTALKVDKPAKAGTKVGRVEPVKALVYSPDGKKLITVGHHDNEPGHLKIWDLTNDKELLAQREIPPAIALAFAPDGQSVACGEENGDIMLRDPNTGEAQSALKGHSLSVQSVAFSPDGHSLVSVGLDGIARLWNLAEKREKQTMRGHVGGIHAVAFFAHGRTFVTGGADHTAKIWDIDGRKEVTLLGHAGAVESVAVSADNKTIATASRDRTIRLWDAATGRETAVLEGDAPFHAVAFSPDGKILAGTAGKSIHLWDTKTQEPIGGLEKQAAPIRALAFSPGGNGLANGSALGLVLLTMQVAQDEAWQEQVQSFKGKAECPPGWELKGDEAERCVRFEPEGLRITVPPSNSPSGRGQGKGLASYQTVKGDFEITVSFEILQEPEPMDAGPQGKATRFSLEIILDKLKPLRNMASITRKVAAAGTSYNAWSVLHDEYATPPETVRTGGAPTSAKTGRLRLSRSGANLSFAVADGLDGEFTLLRQFPFGRENLREVRVVAATGGPKAAIDVRVIDLRIRAESLSDLPQPPVAPAAQVIDERQSGIRWMPAAIVVVVGSATLLGLLLLALRMRRQSRQSMPTASQTQPQPGRGAGVSISCPTCGKPLRVKDDQAGKKLKCPHCGATFQFNQSNASQPEG